MAKKVISFSLYGKHPRYTLGAIANARHVGRAYPGWVCRFYIADDVQKIVVSRLQAHGAEVINMGPRFGHEAKLWRFFAVTDPEVDIAVVRDVDSRFTKPELTMVNEWLASSKKFHVMRFYKCAYPIMAGLWGVRGAIPEVRELLENHLQQDSFRSYSENFRQYSADQRFLSLNLYPLMKEDVFIHEIHSQEKRRYFIGETIHPFPAVAHTYRGKYLNISALPVGMLMPSRRTFITFSIYKRTIFSELFLTFWLGIIEKLDLFRLMNARFYVADNISPDLIERLRRHGRVIVKTAKTARKDDPQYWKLLILSEKDRGVAVIVDFWQLFFLIRATQGKIRLYELLPIEYNRPTRIRSWFTKVATLSVCGPASPVSDIENLMAQRDPNENYREFIRSTVYPRTSTTRMTSVLKSRDNVGFLQGLTRILFPSRLYFALGRVVRVPIMRIVSLKR